MATTKHLPSITLASLGLVLSLGSSAQAFTFVEIANTNTSGFTSIDSIVYSINDSGSVAFSANVGGQSGIFLGNGGAIDTLVDPSEGFVNFSFIDINSIDTAVFITGGNDAIFRTEGGVISSVIDIPSSLGLLGFDAGGFPPFSELFINESGTIAFKVNGAGGEGGIFTANGGVFTPIAELPDFDTFRFSLNNNGEVGFFAISPLAPDGDALFIGDGTGMPTLLADPLGFGTVEGPSLNDAGTVVFDALFVDEMGNALQGIFKQSGGDPQLLVDTSTDFSSFDRQAINNSETIVFDASLDAGFTAIFAGPDPVADRVIGVGDILFGSTIVSLSFTHQTGLNNQGQFAFTATFDDGSVGIFRADPDDSDPQPVPEPMSLLGLFLLGATGVVSRLRDSIRRRRC
ncbi:PEP-CTERM sorting domain-containing protein [Oscillatoria sp. FACHB-1407]|uniref:choice-of-anchor tandem repeat NxxGxxAF-containing protein n=1 Tax=Oscillatoria sp. FACHB-1407 TaxID=2692847 RepID=UPI0016879BD4|nr:choice-of-anchor tandem repeat NxxGxxAF-containing protein [Oscillatoria sp. FACHB-1407]MBD2465486.1 PEP-CTERM sorting domain-containing protein [Oscillatoria sp. FACHB-1407]